MEYWRRWDVHAGLEPDTRGRWGVDGLLDVRRKSGPGRGLQALVRWRGVDPDTGEAWPELWLDVNGTFFTTDLRREARAMERVKYPKPAEAPVRSGARRSARLDPTARVAEADIGGRADEMDDEEEDDQTCLLCGGGESSEGNWMLLCDGVCGEGP